MLQVSLEAQKLQLSGCRAIELFVRLPQGGAISSPRKEGTGGALVLQEEPRTHTNWNITEEREVLHRITAKWSIGTS